MILACVKKNLKICLNELQFYSVLYTFAQRTRKAYIQHGCLYSCELKWADFQMAETSFACSPFPSFFFGLVIGVIKCHKERNETHMLHYVYGQLAVNKWMLLFFIVCQSHPNAETTGKLCFGFPGVCQQLKRKKEAGENRNRPGRKRAKVRYPKVKEKQAESKGQSILTQVLDKGRFLRLGESLSLNPGKTMELRCKGTNIGWAYPSYLDTFNDSRLRYSSF